MTSPPQMGLFQYGEVYTEQNNSRIQFYYSNILLLTGGVSGLYIYFCLLFELLSIAQNERFKAILLPVGTKSSL